METDYLRDFLVFASRMNFTVASSELSMSQPTLTRHIAELERHFGVRLVNRGRSLSLTYAGETLLGGADALLRAQDSLEDSVRGAAESDEGELLVQDWRYSREIMDPMRRKLGELVAEHPGHRVRFLPVPHDMTTEEAVRQKTIDVGILAHTYMGDPVYMEGDDIGVVAIGCFRSHAYIIMDALNPLASKAEVSFSELYGATFLTGIGPEFANIRSDLTAICAAFGYEPVFRMTEHSSIDDVACMDLRRDVAVGTEEYARMENLRLAGVTGRPCAEDVFVAHYLLYRKDDTNPLLTGLISWAEGPADSPEA